MKQKQKKKQGKLYEYLNKQRSAIFWKRYKDNEQFVKTAEASHQTALDLQRALISGTHFN